nr:pancreatic triacylglycerol lipase-like [Procambarus clarkii]
MMMKSSFRSGAHHIMMHCDIVILSLLLWGLSAAEASRLKPVPANTTALPQVTAVPAAAGNWSRPYIDHTDIDDGDYHQFRTVENGSLKDNLIKVQHFFLWTRKTSGNDSQEDLDPTKVNTIIESSFRPRKTYIIIHGFLGWGTEPWILSLKDKLLDVLDCNVISVEWPAGQGWMLLTYYTAVSRVLGVANDTTLLIKSLAAHKALHLKDVHFIGHSLGAHVAGIASKPYGGKIGRITGLDPAGLTYRNVPAEQRIDSSDADYVDILHTNGCYNFWDPWRDCYGLNENLGHSDFWPNGGEHQPACRQANGEYGCDHMMAYKYFLESLDYGIDSTLFLARNCSNWNDYEEGFCSCGENAQYMGFFVDTRVGGIFYLETNSTSPYAVEDAMCSPGNASILKMKRILLIMGTVLSLIGVSGGILAVGIAMSRKRHRQALGSGLLTNEEVQGIDDACQENVQENVQCNTELPDSHVSQESVQCNIESP